MTIDDLQAKVLTALIEAGGDLTVAELDALYEKGQGHKIAGLNRRRLTQWIRPEGNPGGNAIGLRITEAGRAILNQPR